MRKQRAEEIKHLFNLTTVAMRDPAGSKESLRQIASGLERLAWMEGFLPDPVVEDGEVVAIRAMISMLKPQKPDPEFMFDPENAERLEALKKQRVKIMRKKKREAEGKKPRQHHFSSKDPGRLEALRTQALAMNPEKAAEKYKHSFSTGVAEVKDGRRTLRLVVTGLRWDKRTSTLRLLGVYAEGATGGAARPLADCTFV